MWFPQLSHPDSASAGDQGRVIGVEQGSPCPACVPTLLPGSYLHAQGGVTRGVDEAEPCFRVLGCTWGGKRREEWPENHLCPLAARQLRRHPRSPAPVCVSLDRENPFVTRAQAPHPSAAPASGCLRFSDLGFRRHNSSILRPSPLPPATAAPGIGFLCPGAPHWQGRGGVPGCKGGTNSQRHQSLRPEPKLPVRASPSRVTHPGTPNSQKEASCNFRLPWEGGPPRKASQTQMDGLALCRDQGLLCGQGAMWASSPKAAKVGRGPTLPGLGSCSQC